MKHNHRPSRRAPARGAARTPRVVHRNAHVARPPGVKIRPFIARVARAITPGTE